MPNQTIYIMLECVNSSVSLCENVTALKMALTPVKPLFWEWSRMWF